MLDVFAELVPLMCNINKVLQTASYNRLELGPKLFPEADTRDLVLSLPTRAPTATIYYHEATADGNTIVSIHQDSHREMIQLSSVVCRLPSVVCRLSSGVCV